MTKITIDPVEKELLINRPGNEIRIPLPSGINRVTLKKSTNSMDMVNNFIADHPNVEKRFNKVVREAYLGWIYPPRGMNLEKKIAFINKLMTELLSIKETKYRYMSKWVAKHTYIPHDISDTFNKALSVKGHTKHQTYTTEQYIGLITLGVMLKLLSPLWMVYNQLAIDGGEKTSGIVLQRLTYQVLPAAIRETPAWDKLTQFVTQSTANKDLATSKMIAKGMTSGNKIQMIMSLLCQKIIITSFGTKQDKNLASHLYSTVELQFRTDKRTAIRDKSFGVPGGGPEGEYSMVEGYRDQEPLALYEKVTMCYIARFDQLIKYYPDLKITNLRSAYSKLLASKMRYNNIHQTIASTVLRWVLPTDAFNLMEAKEFKASLAVTNALIRERHKQLSLLLLCTYDVSVNPETGVSHPRQMNASLQQLGTKTRNALKEVFPFYTVTGVINPMTADKRLIPKRMLVLNLINQLAASSNIVWEARLSTHDVEYYKDYIKVEGDVIRVIPMTNIAELIAQFFLDIDNLGTVKTRLQEALDGVLEI